MDPNNPYFKNFMQYLEYIRNFQNIQNSPNFQNPSNIPNFPNIQNSPNFQNAPHIQNFPNIQNSPNFQNPSHIPHFQNIPNSPYFQNPSHLPNFPFPPNFPIPLNYSFPHNFPFPQNYPFASGGGSGSAPQNYFGKCCPPSSASDSTNSKRMKINKHGAYSPTSNPKMPVNDGVSNEIEIRPLGIKAAKSAKRKGNSLAQAETEELFQELSTCNKREADKVDIMRSFVQLKHKQFEAKEKVAKAKENAAKYNMMLQLMQIDSLSAQQKLMYDKLYAELFGPDNS
ncbi:hypothetical protein Ancab_005064 [Ancistrocladus abbreviatus]